MRVARNHGSMCFNCSLAATAEIIKELYGEEIPEERFSTPVFFTSGFDHPLWPVLKQGRTPRFDFTTWGLIPSWTKTADDAAKIRNQTINARLETLASKPSFRALVDSRRCGVLLDGFIEWRHHGGKKYPYRITMPEGRPFLVAGLWDRWKDPGSDTTIETHTIVTTKAQGIPAQVHNSKLRMPFILGKTAGDAWLNPDASYQDIEPSIKPFYRTLTAWPVSPKVSIAKAEKNIPEILEPYEYPELPKLLPV